MALQHVRDLVCEHPGKLRLALRGEHQPGMRTDEPARKRERVDHAIAHHEELERLARLPLAAASRNPSAWK